MNKTKLQILKYTSIACLSLVSLTPLLTSAVTFDSKVKSRTSADAAVNLYDYLVNYYDDVQNPNRQLPNYTVGNYFSNYPDVYPLGVKPTDAQIWSRIVNLLMNGNLISNPSGISNEMYLNDLIIEENDGDINGKHTVNIKSQEYDTEHFRVVNAQGIPTTARYVYSYINSNSKDVNFKDYFWANTPPATKDEDGYITFSMWNNATQNEGGQQFYKPWNDSGSQTQYGTFYKGGSPNQFDITKPEVMLTTLKNMNALKAQQYFPANNQKPKVVVNQLEAADLRISDSSDAAPNPYWQPSSDSWAFVVGPKKDSNFFKVSLDLKIASTTGTDTLTGTDFETVVPNIGTVSLTYNSANTPNWSIGEEQELPKNIYLNENLYLKDLPIRVKENGATTNYKVSFKQVPNKDNYVKLLYTKKRQQLTEAGTSFDSNLGLFYDDPKSYITKDNNKWQIVQAWKETIWGKLQNINNTDTYKNLFPEDGSTLDDFNFGIDEASGNQQGKIYFYLKGNQDYTTNSGDAQQFTGEGTDDSTARASRIYLDYQLVQKVDFDQLILYYESTTGEHYNPNLIFVAQPIIADIIWAINTKGGVDGDVLNGFQWDDVEFYRDDNGQPATGEGAKYEPSSFGDKTSILYTKIDANQTRVWIKPRPNSLNFNPGTQLCIVFAVAA